MICKNCIYRWNTRIGTICLARTYEKAIRDGYERVVLTDCCDKYEKINKEIAREERKETE